MTGDKAQDFVDYLENKTGLKLQYKTENGITTITGAKTNKDFKGEINKEFAKIVKEVAGASDTAKFNVSSNMSNSEGNVFMDDNGNAWNSQTVENGKLNIRPGNVDFADIQSLDNQASEFCMALVGHFLTEGLKMRDLAIQYDGGHKAGLAVEGRILSEALGAKQDRRYQYPESGITTDMPFSFVYTTVQYDMVVKSSGTVTVNKVAPPTIQRPK